MRLVQACLCAEKNLIAPFSLPRRCVEAGTGDRESSFTTVEVRSGSCNPA